MGIQCARACARGSGREDIHVECPERHFEKKGAAPDGVFGSKVFTLPPKPALARCSLVGRVTRARGHKSTTKILGPPGSSSNGKYSPV